MTAYKCPAGVWTIGFGHTGTVDGKPITEGMTITAEKAEELLRGDLRRFEKGVLERVKVPLTQSQFDSITSLAFNIGLGAFGDSTVLKRLNAMDYSGAARAFGLWVKAKGMILEGLVRRRVAEIVLFMGGAPP